MTADNAMVAATRTRLQQARFGVSVPDPRQLPADSGREIAFAGRSNSGKSSALNVLCQQRSLARTSRTPGRTQHIVVFDVAPGQRLVDLPGFGYAKVSKAMRAHWDKALPRYLEQRQSLSGLILLADIRHPLKTEEQVLIDWCIAAEVPVHLLLNKADKLSRGAAAAAVAAVRRAAGERCELGLTLQPFSALKRSGCDQAWGVIGAWLGDAQAAPASG